MIKATRSNRSVCNFTLDVRTTYEGERLRRNPVYVGVDNRTSFPAHFTACRQVVSNPSCRRLNISKLYNSTNNGWIFLVDASLDGARRELSNGVSYVSLAALVHGELCDRLEIDQSACSKLLEML